MFKKMFPFVLVFALIMSACGASGTPAPTSAAPTLEPTATLQPTVAATQAPTSTPSAYPLVDQKYTSPQGDAYNAIWDKNGWLHQPNLPTGRDRAAHEVSFTIQPGNYSFNGVECQLFLNETRKDGGEKFVAERGNGLKFSVTTADNGEAWGRVSCRKSEASGFSIEFRGP